MIFTLEAMRAKHGDSLLLHYGEPAAPRLVLIDGGPPGVWTKTLKPRLDQLKQERSGAEPLPVRLLMVSHIDDDHIRGILDLTKGLTKQSEAGQPLDWEIAELWHNSFDDLVGEGADALVNEASVGLSPASLDGGAPLPAGGVSHPSALVLANVAQGRTLRLDARKLGLALNPTTGGGPITGAAAGEAPADLGDGLALRVLAPSRRRVDDLQKEWAKELARRKEAPAAARLAAAAYVDDSVFNLSSLVVMAEAVTDGAAKRMLLTGDARGDDVLAGLEHAGLLEPGGTIHVDVLKLPHHGSDRNVATDFFRRVTADHYIVSGDGKYGNPEVATFEMIFAARGDDRPFALHLTYAPEELIDDYPQVELQELLRHQRDQGARFELVTPTVGATSLSIQLGREGLTSPG
jgi:hypothetical protein